MEILENVNLGEKTTFGCGGSARWFCEVNNFLEFENLVKWHKGKLFVLGAGSKTICCDNGFWGLVISTKKLNHIQVENNTLICDCGVRFCDLHNLCEERGLSGLEWSAGIPASVGGAVVMNAGAFGHEFCECVEKVQIFEKNTQKILNFDEINFFYRNSSLKNKFVEKVWLKLKKSSPQEVATTFQEYLHKKQTNQPVCVGSAGSVFKRKNGVIPAKIIDKLGLKGVKIGKAEISVTHSGFIVNTGGATATDVLALTNYIKSEVQKKCGILLEEELIVLE